MRHIVLAMAALAIPTEAAAAAFTISCEIERTISVSDQGREPLKRLRIRMWDIAVDPQTRTIAITDMDGEGRPRTLVWNATLITDDLLVFCTYNIKCGEALTQPSGQFVSSMLVMPTTVDLKRNLLNRTIRMTNSRGGQIVSVRTEDDYAICRRN